MHGYTSPDEVIGQHFSLVQVETDLEYLKSKVIQVRASVVRK